MSRTFYMIHCLTEAVGMLVCSVYNVAEGWSKVHKYQSGVPSWKMLVSWCVRVYGSHHHIWYHSFTCVWLCDLCLCRLAWVRLTAFDLKKSGLVILALYCSYINNINLFKVSEFYVLSMFLFYSVG